MRIFNAPNRSSCDWRQVVYAFDFRCFPSQFVPHKSLHTSNLLLVQVLVEARVKVLPPLEEHRVANELEPRSEEQAGVVELLLELLGSDVLGISDLVLVDIEINVGLDKENVVNCVFMLDFAASKNWLVHTLVLTPLSVTGSLVVNTGQEVEVLERNLLLLDAQFMLKLALGGSLDTSNRVLKSRTSLGRDVKRVGAAGVGPHVGEGDLLGSALLEEELVLVVEEEDREGTVKEALVNVGHEMAWQGLSQ